MSINDELRDMRERLERATEGPWVPRDLSDAVFDSENDAGWWWVWQESKLPYYGGVLGPDTHGSIDGSIGEASITDARDGHQEKADATFIAHARTDLPRLLDAVERVMDKTSPIIAGTGDRYRAGRRDMALEIRNLIAESLDVQ